MDPINATINKIYRMLHEQKEKFTDIHINVNLQISMPNRDTLLTHLALSFQYFKNIRYHLKQSFHFIKNFSDLHMQNAFVMVSYDETNLKIFFLIKKNYLDRKTNQETRCAYHR